MVVYIHGAECGNPNMAHVASPLTKQRSYDYDEVSYKFTGKERDSESNLDYFGARYYAPMLGRFISPDDPDADQDPADPQSWNLYTYVRNNPLNYTDPSGAACAGGIDGCFNEAAAPGNPPKHAGTCGFWCRLRLVLFSGNKTLPAPRGYGELAAVYNTVAGGYNFSQNLGYALSGHESLLDNHMPFMTPTNKTDAEAMRNMDLALLFIPGVDEPEIAELIEEHHLLPQENALKEIFEGVGLDIEEFTVNIRRSKHRLLSGKGLHTKIGGDWNGVWRKFLANPQNRTKERILEQLGRMILEVFHNGAA